MNNDLWFINQLVALSTLCHKKQDDNAETKTNPSYSFEPGLHDKACFKGPTILSISPAPIVRITPFLYEPTLSITAFGSKSDLLGIVIFSNNLSLLTPSMGSSR